MSGRRLVVIAACGLVALAVVAYGRNGGSTRECRGEASAGVQADDAQVCVQGVILGCFDAGTGTLACHDGQPQANLRRPLRVVAGGQVELQLHEDAASVTADLRDHRGRPLRAGLPVTRNGKSWTANLPRDIAGGGLALGVSAQRDEPSGRIEAFLIALETK